MALFDEHGVPKTRPVPQDNHVAHFQKEADRKRAIEITMLKEGLPWNEAAEKVDAAGHETVLGAHHGPQPVHESKPVKKFSFEPGYLPSAEDLDRIADEEKAKEETAGNAVQE